MKYNPRSVRAALIAKHLPDLDKTYKLAGSLSEVVNKLRNFGIDNMSFSNDVDKNYFQKMVFGCTDVVLKIGIRHAYQGMPDIDFEKNPKTLPNAPFEPIFPDYEIEIGKFAKKNLLQVCGFDEWRDDEKNFVYKWHGKGKLPRQIANGYQKLSVGGQYDDGTIEPFTKRTPDSVIHFINHCYDDGRLKPQRINWEKQEDLAFAAYWISYLERNNVSYKGYIKRTVPILNEHFFGGNDKLSDRSLECFLKRDKSYVEQVEQKEGIY